ncbi:hypothetical protein QFZ67_006688 [Streptomyces sp. V1I1]|nr:hypothetical protein [Streptomyces sp. V1I1]
MHRPKTTAKVLAGVAVWAVSGCVAVQPEPVPAPPSHSGRPAQAVAPQIVQRPAREVLAPPPLTAPLAQTAAPPAEPAPAARHMPNEQPTSPPPKPRTAEPPALPPLRPLPAVGPDVCALGESYGRWRPGSPESRICQEAYGS